MPSTDGFVAIPKHILQNTSLNPESIVLYAHLLHFDRGAKGLGCIAKRSTLSKMSGLSLHKLRKAILNLEENGIVSVIRRRNSLTDRIRINPDCRPQLSTSAPAAKRSPRSRLKNSTTQETKKLNSSSLRANKNTQDNKISSQSCSNSDIEKEITNKPTEIISKTTIESKRESKPYSILPKRTETVRNDLRGSVRETTYQRYLADLSVTYEDNNSLTLHTPKGNLYKEFITNRFYDDLKRIVGKEIVLIT